MDEARYNELVEKASKLMLNKARDYNQGAVTLHDYFPFGSPSYVQMIHVKAQRLVSLMEMYMKNEGGEPQYEAIQDSVLDLINYSVIFLDYLYSEEL